MTGPTTTSLAIRLELAAPASDPDWRSRGLCLNEDPELFFADGKRAEAFLQIEQAKAVCRRCPVRETCLAWALKAEQDHGVWGGLSARERRRLTATGTQRHCETCGDLLDRQGARPLCKACLTEEKTEQARQVLERRRKILDLANKGLSNAEIAKRTGVDSKTVSGDLRRIRQYGIPALTPPRLTADTTAVRRSPDMLDLVAVERAMAGKPVPLTKAERKEAVRRLRAKGTSLTQIAATLRMSPRQVRLDLDLEKRRQPAAAPAEAEESAA